MRYGYDRLAALRVMYDTLRRVCDDVYVDDRPSSVTDQLKEFLVVGLRNYRTVARTYKTMYAQVTVYVKDGIHGTERSDVIERLKEEVTDAVLGMDKGLLRLIDAEPYIGDPKVDGAGFHAVTLQWKVRVV